MPDGKTNRDPGNCTVTVSSLLMNPIKKNIYIYIYIYIIMWPWDLPRNFKLSRRQAELG